MNKTIVVTQLLEADLNRVWQAIIQKYQMVLWFFDNIPEFSPDSCRAGWEFFINRKLVAYLHGDY